MWHKISINVAVCSFYGKIVCSMRQCRMLHVASVEFRLKNEALFTVHKLGYGIFIVVEVDGAKNLVILAANTVIN